MVSRRSYIGLQQYVADISFSLPYMNSSSYLVIPSPRILSTSRGDLASLQLFRLVCDSIFEKNKLCSLFFGRFEAHLHDPAY
jgi:hypothetical protein